MLVDILFILINKMKVKQRRHALELNSPINDVRESFTELDNSF